MEYALLTSAQHTEVRRQKLLELEAEHARLALDLKLAEAVGLKSEQVAIARANLALVERQHQVLREVMAPPAAEPTDNGSAPTPDLASTAS